MDKQQLHVNLEQLHTAIHKVDFADSRERETLKKIANDIQEILSRQGDQPEHYGGLSQRLKTAVAELEASHPEATLLMRQMIDQLAYLGI